MACSKVSFNTIANVLASVSAVGLAAVIGAGSYVYVNREAIIEDVKEKAIEAVMQQVGGGLGGGALTGEGLGLPGQEASTNASSETSLGIPTF
jgi:hypothetical protein